MVESMDGPLLRFANASDCCGRVLVCRQSRSRLPTFAASAKVRATPIHTIGTNLPFKHSWSPD